MHRSLNGEPELLKHTDLFSIDLFVTVALGTISLFSLALLY